jgi:hypothetical protein
VDARGSSRGEAMRSLAFAFGCNPRNTRSLSSSFFSFVLCE